MINQTLQARLLRGPMTRQQAETLWSDDYSPTFEPNTQNLFRTHKVSKFKKRYQRS